MIDKKAEITERIIWINIYKYQPPKIIWQNVQCYDIHTHKCKYTHLHDFKKAKKTTYCLKLSSYLTKIKPQIMKMINVKFRSVFTCVLGQKMSLRLGISTSGRLITICLF